MLVLNKHFPRAVSFIIRWNIHNPTKRFQCYLKRIVSNFANNISRSYFPSTLSGQTQCAFSGHSLAHTQQWKYQIALSFFPHFCLKQTDSSKCLANNFLLNLKKVFKNDHTDISFLILDTFFDVLRALGVVDYALRCTHILTSEYVL